MCVSMCEGVRVCAGKMGTVNTQQKFKSKIFILYNQARHRRCASLLIVANVDVDVDIDIVVVVAAV